MIAKQSITFSFYRKYNLNTSVCVFVCLISSLKKEKSKTKAAKKSPTRFLFLLVKHKQKSKHLLNQINFISQNYSMSIFKSGIKFSQFFEVWETKERETKRKISNFEI